MNNEPLLLKQTIGAKLRRFFFGLNAKESDAVLQLEKEANKRLAGNIYKGGELIKCDRKQPSPTDRWYKKPIKITINKI